MILKKVNSKYFYNLIYILFIVFIAAPFIYTLINTFTFDSSFYDNLSSINSNLFILLFKSILISGSVGILSTLFGIIFGLIIYKTNINYSSILKTALLIPLIISPYILAVAWKDFFYIAFNNYKILSSNLGVILIHTSIFAPLSILIIGNSLNNINSELEESSLLIISLRKTILKVIIPLIKPAIASSFILVFIFSISEFSVPAFLGVKVFTTEIFTQFSAFYNHSLAIMQSTLLIAISLLLLYSEKKHISNADYFTISSKGNIVKKYNFKNGIILILFWIFLSILLPIITLAFQAFAKGSGNILTAIELLIPAILNSVYISFVSASIIVFLGFIIAYFSRKNNILNWLLLIGFTIPSVVIGISLIKFYNHAIFNFIYSTYTIIIIGFIIKYLFIASKLISNSLKQIPNSIIEISKIEGISSFSTITKIIIPLISSSLFISFVLIFIFSFGELGLTIMLSPPGSEILPIKIFTLMANSSQAQTSAMALVSFLAIIFIISILHILYKLFFNDKSK